MRHQVTDMGKKRTDKLFWLILLLLSIPLLSCSTLLPEKYTAEVLKGQCLPAFPDKDGWYGGDGAYSIKLDGDRTLWLFGDTFVANEEGRKDRVDMDVILGTTLAISTCSVNPARLGIPRLQPGEECAVTRGRSRYYREPPAPAGGGSTI